MKLTFQLINPCGCLVLLVFYLTSPTVCAQASYNEVQLRNYARLCQQLRTEMLQMSQSLSDRYDSLKERLEDLESITDQGSYAAESAIINSTKDLQIIGDLTKANYADAMLVWKANVYRNPHRPGFTTVQFINGDFVYNTDTGKLTFYKDGIYLIMIRLDIVDMGYVVWDFIVYSPDGGGGEIIECYSVFSGQQCYRTLAVRGGTVMEFSNYSFYERYMHPLDFATQMIVQYLGSAPST